MHGSRHALRRENLLEGGAHLFHQPAVGRHLAVIERDTVMDLCIQIFSCRERKVGQADRIQGGGRREHVTEVDTCKLKGDVVEDAGVEQDSGVVFHGVDGERDAGLQLRSGQQLLV